MKRPPVVLEDSEKFAWSFMLLGPIVVALAWAMAAKSYGWWASETLQFAGTFGQFFAFAMLSWKSMHFDKAEMKLDECISYDTYLDERLESEEIRHLSNLEKFNYLNKVRELRQLNKNVIAISLNYELTKPKMMTRGFFFFTCSTMIVLVAIIAT